MCLLARARVCLWCARRCVRLCVYKGNGLCVFICLCVYVHPSMINYGKKSMVIMMMITNIFLLLPQLLQLPLQRLMMTMMMMIVTMMMLVVIVKKY